MGFYSESMPEPKCQIDWSKDGSSNLADLHWSDLHQEETEITVSSFSYDSNEIKRINEATNKVAFLNEHRQLLSRIERLPKA